MPKICVTCKIEKNEIDFQKNKANKDGLQYSCRDCRKIYVRNHYLANKSSYIARSKVGNEKQYQKYDDFKSQFKCIICDEKESCCLDFHHIDPTTKKFTIAQARKNKMSLASIKDELAKCIVLCSNCHRKLHAGVISLPGY